MKIITSALIILISFLGYSQNTSNSIVKNIPFTNIGPSIMSGRVVDIEVNPNNPNEFYVGYASGGVWHTINNGTSFNPILDTSNTQNVGDIAVDWRSKTIWVGTGEVNASRSSYAGIGILKSTDNGKTWQNMGLTDSHHIARILINTNNPDEVIVGVTGHLYTPNKQRGIYKTIDGGKTWTQTLFIDEQSGIIDMSYDPTNFNTIYASSWTKNRKAWHFNGSGKNSAIYKSTDAGITWTNITASNSGFPTGNGVGRIGLAVFDSNTIYAIHDNQNRRPKTDKKLQTDQLNKADFKTMTIDAFMALDNKTLGSFLKANGFHEKYTPQSLKQLVKSGTAKPKDIATYLEDANSLLLDTPVIGTEVYKSDNGGKTWTKTHNNYLDDIYFSYGYYFGRINVSPVNKNDIYIYGVPILKSKDGGKTFTSINANNVHADHHYLWINPKNPKHLINGNDGGVNISYDDGVNWIKNNSPSVGQFYAINVDHETPYNIYGGLQDNGVWVASSTTKENTSWHQNGQYPWQSIMGGDGMQIQIDNRDANIVYTGFQFGNYFRLNRKTGSRTYIQPKHKIGESPYRFNWQTPILLSKHNQDIIYLGGNKLMRSLNQGNDWEAISGDLTQGGKKGNVTYGTLTSISESPLKFGLIYTGSDDGLVHITKNGGDTWNTISQNLPPHKWISRVIASKHKKERVYVSLNGYRDDEFSVYIYMSDDYGATWKNLSKTITPSPVNVIIEDPVNANIIYAGTDNGAYVSLNNGMQWHAFSKNLPKVAIHDMVIEPKTNDLILGTHGRSIYKTNVAMLQEFNLNTTTALFKLPTIKYSNSWGNSWNKWIEPITPNVAINFYTAIAEKKQLKLITTSGKLLKQFTVDTQPGFNVINYDLTLNEKAKKTLEKTNESLIIKKAKNNKYYLPKGTYKLELDGKMIDVVVE